MTNITPPIATLPETMSPTGIQVSFGLTPVVSHEDLTSLKQDTATTKMIDRIPSLCDLSAASISNHNDATSDCDDSSNPEGGVSRGGVPTPFPWKLHDMLEKVDDDGYSHIVSWQPHGRCFAVHKPKEFVETVMPIYFNQTKFASFQRQLNLYGFHRLTTGRDKGAYYHESFLRGKRTLCQNMTRIKIKGTKVRRAMAPALEPQFYSMPFMPTKDGGVTIIPSTQAARRLMMRPKHVLEPARSPQHEDAAPLCFFEGKPFHFFDKSMVLEPSKCDASSLKRENTVIQTWMTVISN